MIVRPVNTSVKMSISGEVFHRTTTTKRGVSTSAKIKRARRSFMSSLKQQRTAPEKASIVESNKQKLSASSLRWSPIETRRPVCMKNARPRIKHRAQSDTELRFLVLHARAIKKRIACKVTQAIQQVISVIEGGVRDSGFSL
eukprot:TRINITY_DN14235_c0_g1_i2.p3 TRINITY_DN14235_c0_g1~~TRINITY_DN14235_c0_g1_i2.p3  ORF type:complete len:142 (+),score=6.61 TRINITY_DN14235_c0_g1_i2:464-889(+)